MNHWVLVNIIVTKQLSSISFILLDFMETSNSTTKNGYSLMDKFRFTVDFSWGVGSLRQCAGFPASFLDPKENTSYLTPLGSLVVCWDIVTGRRKFSFQAHSDLITVMLYNSRSNAVLTVCYSGEIKIWNSTWKVILDQKARIGGIHFADWLSNGCRFLLCGGDESELIVYDILNNDKGWSIHEKWSVSPPVANQKIHVEDKANYAQSSKENGDPGSSTYVQQKDYYDMAVFTSDNKVVALLQRHHGKLSEAHLYAENGDFLQQQALDPLGDAKASLMCLSQCHNGTFAVGFQGGIFLLLNEHNLSIMAVLQATGSPQVAVWHGDYLLALSYLSGIFSWWTSRGELVHELSGGPTNSIVHLNWAVPGKSLWVGGIMSLHIVSLHYSDSSETFPSRLEEFHSLKFLEVTGCGVAISDANLVVAGDFTGNVLVLEKGQTEPIYRTKSESAVRSLTWNGGLVFIGCLDGNLLRWFPGNGSNPSITLACIGGILTMDWSHDHSCLALGLDTGHLCVYKFKGQDPDEPTEVLNVKAHFIKCDDQEVAAEIWSVCWSPCEEMIATASEDQTTSVWQLCNGQKLDTLTGHTTAVTSVDWKTMSSGQVILATCADDRTVRIHDGVTFQLRHVLSTKDINGWYTLTYLSLNTVRQWCLCSTQNGRLVLWDCITGERLGCRKMHAGSIEGLVWNKDYTLCATVSSDCVVNMFSVNNVNKSDL